LLTTFYTKHNPSKANEVELILTNFAGAEDELFERLARKYNVVNPLDASSKATPLPPLPPAPRHSSVMDARKEKGLEIQFWFHHFLRKL